MSKDPAFLFYYQDFAYGTRRMTFEEKGCYIELLCEQADSGHLTPKDIRRILKSSYPIWEAICSKFDVDENGYFFNKVLDEHITKRKKYTESRKNNLKGSYMDAHMDAHMENVNVNKNEIINVVDNNKIPFDVFWDAYDKKVGKKDKIKKRWYKQSEEIQMKILKHIELYKLSQPDKQYRKNPDTYFNNESWNDEIIIKERNNGSNKPVITESELRKFAESVANDPRLK